VGVSLQEIGFGFEEKRMYCGGGGGGEGVELCGYAIFL
jgi:hypothetical protein